MARKKSAAAVAAAAARAATNAALAQESDDIEVEVDDDPADTEDELDALRSLRDLGADGGNYRYIVRCISPPDRRGTIEEVTREDLLDLPFTLRDRFGPGVYTVSTIGPRGFVRGGHRTIRISNLIEKRAGAVPTMQGPAPRSFEEWERQAEQREERRKQQMREDLKFYAGLAASVLPAMLGQRESISSIMSALKDAREMMGGGAGSDKVLDALMEGLKLGKDYSGGAESWPGVIRETIRDLTGSPLGQQLAARAAARARIAAQPEPQGAFPKPQPKSAQVPYESPQPESRPMTQRAAPPGFPPEVWAQVILPLMNRLADEMLEYAQNGADPGLAAEALVAKIPRPVRAMLKPEQAKEWLTNANWWQLLRDFRPALEPYQGYCDDVRVQLFQQFEPVETPENP